MIGRLHIPLHLGRGQVVCSRHRTALLNGKTDLGFTEASQQWLPSVSWHYLGMGGGVPQKWIPWIPKKNPARQGRISTSLF